MTDDEHIEEGESLIPQLPEDNDPPFSPPTTGGLNPTHQVTDNATDIDSQELYDGAAEVSEPNAGNAVVDYDPEADERKNVA